MRGLVVSIIGSPALPNKTVWAASEAGIITGSALFAPAEWVTYRANSYGLTKYYESLGISSPQ